MLLAVGIIQLLIAQGIIELTGIARFFPVGIVLLNFGTFLVITAVFQRELFRITIPQIIVFVLIIALQLVSISG